MYYPVQIPYILDSKFRENVVYKEKKVHGYENFIICFWEIRPSKTLNVAVENIIVPDGCIDLVVDFTGKNIGYSGMSRTEFNFEIPANSISYGVRFKPGVFHQFTGLHATAAMDEYLPLKLIDSKFDMEKFFLAEYYEQKQIFINYVCGLCNSMDYSLEFVNLFERLYNHMPSRVSEIYSEMGYSPKQCQRLFLKNFGMSPKKILAIIRFQSNLKIIISNELNRGDFVNSQVGYHDQPHLIRDMKRNLGITPYELYKIVQGDEFVQETSFT